VSLLLHLLELLSLILQEIRLRQEVVLLGVLLLLLVDIPVEGFLPPSLPAPREVIYLLELIEIF